MSTKQFLQSSLHYLLYVEIIFCMLCTLKSLALYLVSSRCSVRDCGMNAANVHGSSNCESSEGGIPRLWERQRAGTTGMHTSMSDVGTEAAVPQLTHGRKGAESKAH